MATIEQNLTKLVNARTSIANAITAKGGTVAQGDGFEEFPADIATIPAGGGVPTTWKYIKPNFSANAKIVSKYWDTISQTFPGITFQGQYVWSDGTDIYYSNGTSYQYVFNKTTSTWTTKTWNSYTNIKGQYIWSDGTDIYYSNGSTQKVLDKSTSTWSNKTWTNFTNIDGTCIWTDGTNIYYSYSAASNRQYVLDKSTSSWNAQTWNGYSYIIGSDVWTDGIDIYYSNYKLNKATATWTQITMSGITGTFYPYMVWTDGENTYYSDTSATGSALTHYKFIPDTYTWTTCIIPGYSTTSVPDASNIWTDGDNIYCSNTHKLVITSTNATILTTKSLMPFS